MARMNTIYSDLNINFGLNQKGALLTNLDDVNQSIHRILTTPVGYDTTLEYGSYIPLMLQEPRDSNTAFQLKGYAVQALNRWEPRIQLIEEEIFFREYGPDGFLANIPYYVLKNNLLSSFRAVFETSD